MRDARNIRELVRLQPDYIGFILFPGSKRYLGDDYHLEEAIPSGIQKVGVFVNATLDVVLGWYNRLALDYVQIHGNEPAEYCQELSQMGIRVIKAFGVDTDFDFSRLKAYRPWCEYFLFDTKTSGHGGSGKQFDWRLLSGYTLDTPIFLSGGIGPGDVEALQQIQGLPIHAIDINSCFEEAPAVKNIALLEQFFSSFRNQ